MPDAQPSPATPNPSPSPDSPDAAQPFRVLYVCTGNICRSAVAERLLRLRLRQGLGELEDLFEVTSAGVQGLTGEPMDEDAAAELHKLGGRGSGFVARRLDADQIRAADLILTANRKHRSSVVRVDASAARRTFTIREFARLAEEFDTKYLPDVDPSTRLQAVVEEIAASRGTVRPAERSDFDVEDPYGGSKALHRRIAAQIDGATTATASLLLAAVRPRQGSGPAPGQGPPTPLEPDDSSETIAPPRSGRVTPPPLAPVAFAAASIDAGENPGADKKSSAAGDEGEWWRGSGDPPPAGEEGDASEPAKQNKKKGWRRW